MTFRRFHSQGLIFLFLLIFLKKYYKCLRYLLRLPNRLKSNGKWFWKDFNMILEIVLDRLVHCPLFTLFHLGLDLKDPKIKIQTINFVVLVLVLSYFQLSNYSFFKKFLSLFKLNLDFHHLNFLLFRFVCWYLLKYLPHYSFLN